MMRIVIDLQGAQTDGASSGLKERIFSLVREIVRNKGEHTVILALSSLFPETIEPLRRSFGDLLTRRHIRAWEAVAPVRASCPANTWRREAAERIREAFLAGLEPDVLFIPNFFIGYDEDGVSSIGRFAPVPPTVVALLEPHRLKPPRTLTEKDVLHDHLLEQKIADLRGASRIVVPFDKDAVSCETELSVGRNALDSLFLFRRSEERLQKEFPFEKAARKLIGIFEQSFYDKKNRTFSGLRSNKPRLAYVSPLPPTPSGVAEYSAKLLRRLGNYYEITVVTDQQQVDDAWIHLHCAIQNPQWLEENHRTMERVLYHFGNAPIHLYMFRLLENIPGVVFLHDFSLSGLLGYRDHFGHIPQGGTKDVYLSHGYKALQKKFRTEEREFVAEYPINFSVIRNALGVIVHQEQAKKSMRDWYGPENDAFCDYIPISEAMGAHMRKGSIPPTVQTIEKYYGKNSANPQALIRSIRNTCGPRCDEKEIVGLSRAVASTFPRRTSGKQLLIDVSVVCRDDFKTGIQRVARALLLALLDFPPEGYRVEPVYLFNEGIRWHYRYARRFATTLLECPSDILTDEVAEIQNGDILFCPDLAVDMTIEANKDGLYRNLRNRGVVVFFMLHDILPLTMPHYFDEGVGDAHAKWLETIVGMDGCICVSKAVADELRCWMENHVPRRLDSLRIEWSHHGADIEKSAPSAGLPEDAADVLSKLSQRTTFLMVGTVEPRKGHRQALQAFDTLWQRKVECNLVIVGKIGWMMESLIDEIQSHNEHGRRLFWLKSISDEYLEKVYNSSSCLLFASEGEGFGLPLIEAAGHGLPIIARDIPVFREVAGAHAFYFSGLKRDNLADAIEEWIGLRDKNAHPGSEDMPWLTWKESAERVKAILLADGFPQ